jgi:hypothetical protein
LYSLQLIFTARLKTAGVVEDIAFVVGEDEFVIDVVFSTLQAGIPSSAVAKNNTLVTPLSWVGVQPG